MARQRSSTRDEFDRLKDAAHKLKAENRRLRKENGQLRKELNRVSDAKLDASLEEEPEDLIIVSVESTEKLFCPKCRIGEVKIISAGRYRIRMCSCGYRKRSET